MSEKEIASDKAFHQTLDVTGLKCPLPVLKAQKSLRSLSPGDVLEVLATDPGSVMDFQCLCEKDNLDLIAQFEENGVFIHHLKLL